MQGSLFELYILLFCGLVLLILNFDVVQRHRYKSNKMLHDFLSLQ